MLTKAQIAILNKARETLEDVQQKLASEESFAHGRLAEACEHASDVIFNVLNIASVYSLTEIAQEDLIQGGDS